MMRWRETLSRLQRLAGLGRRRRWLLVEAALWLVASRLALVMIPFPLLAQRLGTFGPPEAESRPCASELGRERAQVAHEVGWAVTRAARHLPVRAVCLPQAIAARIMLRRRGVPSVIHFGAAKSAGEPLEAHAWLDAAGVEVTGFPVAHRFTELGSFE